MKVDELQSYLQKQIPMTHHLGIQISMATEDQVVIQAPLKANRNHLGTAFGGSLNSILVLACYTWLFNILSLHRQKKHIVIKESQVRYLLPVNEDFKAVCRRPSDEGLNRFLDAFDRKGRARIQLSSQILTSKGVACEFQGEFVTVEFND